MKSVHFLAHPHRLLGLREAQGVVQRSGTRLPSDLARLDTWELFPTAVAVRLISIFYSRFLVENLELQSAVSM